MRFLIGIIAFLIWGGVCIQWYVCGIKELCNEEIEVINEAARRKLPAKDSITTIPEKETITPVNFSITKATIYFPFAKNKTEISKNKTDSLKIIVSELKGTDAVLLLYGNTDKIGTEENNYKLGEERAQWVKNQLVLYGLSADKIQVQSNGESQPISSNDTKTGRAKNRRVDIIVKTK